MSTDVVSDPLVAAGLLLGMAALLLVLGLAIQAAINRRRGHSFADRQDPAEELGPDQAEAVRATTIEGPLGPEKPPSEDWMALVPPWIEALESKLSTAFEQRVSEIEQGFEARIEGVEDRLTLAIEEVEDDLDTGLDQMDSKIAPDSGSSDDRQRQEQFDVRLEEVRSRLEAVEALASGATDNGSPGERMPNGVPPNGSDSVGDSRAQETVDRARRNLFGAFRTQT